MVRFLLSRDSKKYLIAKFWYNETEGFMKVILIKEYDYTILNIVANRILAW